MCVSCHMLKTRLVYETQMSPAATGAMKSLKQSIQKYWLASRYLHTLVLPHELQPQYTTRQRKAWHPLAGGQS